MTTLLGTRPYQAPEINERKPYSGEAVDLFALAIVLFITVAGTPPFSEATKAEFYYKLIVAKKWDTFWKYHVKGKPRGSKFFSDTFKDLMQKMLAYEPSERLTMSQVKSHPWMQGDIPSQSTIQQEFLQRKAANDEEQERERALKQHN
jgi:serine/threonine protein kinase